MNIENTDDVNARLAELGILPPDEGFESLADALEYLSRTLMCEAAEYEEATAAVAAMFVRDFGFPAEGVPTRADIQGSASELYAEALAAAIAAQTLRGELRPAEA